MSCCFNLLSFWRAIAVKATRQGQNLCKRVEAHAHRAAYVVQNLGNTCIGQCAPPEPLPYLPVTPHLRPWITRAHRAWHQRNVDQSFTVHMRSSKATGKSGKGGRSSGVDDAHAQTMGTRCRGRDGQIVSRCFEYVSSEQLDQAGMDFAWPSIERNRVSPFAKLR